MLNWKPTFRKSLRSPWSGSMWWMNDNTEGTHSEESNSALIIRLLGGIYPAWISDSLNFLWIFFSNLQWNITLTLLIQNRRDKMPILEFMLNKNLIERKFVLVHRIWCEIKINATRISGKIRANWRRKRYIQPKIICFLLFFCPTS